MEKTPKSYVNPILRALEYQAALDSGKYKNQTELAKSLNVTRSRVNRYLRLLKLPEEIREDLLSGRLRTTERKVRRFLYPGHAGLPDL